ncbi:MAG: UDP-N-acetylmuramoyl-L-alanyl-D-glutamate--2,6-diaminopimelate ligase [Oscillospiraceae bacterium]|nr:UDP-N-acetylmuramoyl-L-alanyl-D-glutamate--2,6-diaminopimelate ligase [Oscillospiraceae bacterium]
MKLISLLRDIEVLELHAPEDLEIGDLCYDSRKVTPGAAFVAVRGYETDGHRFIPAAAEAGAAVVLCEEAPAAEVPWVLVKDSRRAMAISAANFFGRPAEELTVVGVTGTNGKTTTTNLVRSLLTAVTGEGVGLIGTNENIVGDRVYPAEHTTPESRDLMALFREMADIGAKYAVMEVSSHSLYLDRVCCVPFAVGCFTNLSQDHLDFHRTMDAYLEAKMKLFPLSRAAAVNRDDAAAEKILSALSIPAITYGLGEDADLRAVNLRLEPDRVEFTACFRGEEAEACLHIPGRFSVYNALAAIACCLSLGLPLASLCAALGECKSVKGRMEVVPTGRDFTLLIDYAVTPDALENMLRTVRDTARGRVGVLFGCGGDRDRTKRPKMARVVGSLADYVIVTSDNPRTEDPEAIIREILPGFRGLDTPVKVITDRREAIRWGIEHAQAGDTLVLAGKGHETYQIVGRTKYHMDEREIAAQVLAGM